MTYAEIETVLEAVETPNQNDYSEDQEASCVALSCDGKKAAATR